MKQEFENVTLYLMGSFGASRIECKKLSIEVKPAGGYAEVLFIRFTEKGKRKETVSTQSRKPFALVLGGFGHPKQVQFKDSSFGGQQTLYGSFDPRWRRDFDAMINAHILATSAIVCADHRGSWISIDKTLKEATAV